MKMSPAGAAAWLILFSPGITGAEALRTAAEVRALGPAGMAEKVEVRITGVVTSVRGEDYPDFTMQDATGGIVVQLAGPVGGRVRPGQKVEAAGVTDTGMPYPRVKADSFRVTGQDVLPQPVKAGVSEMASGALDCTYVEFSGVIRRAQVEESIVPTRIVLDFGPEDRRLAVWVSHFDEGLREKLVPDAAVTVRGVCNTWRSASFQPVSTFIVVADPQAVRIDQEGGGEAAMRPMQEVLSLPADDFRARRERVEGRVTLAWPDGQVVIQEEGGAAIRARALGAGTALRPGDRVEATGFPTRRDGRVVLEDAVFTEAAGGSVVTPERMTAGKLAERLKKQDLEARLVRMPAVFRRAALEDGSRVISLEDGGREVMAFLPRGMPLPKDLAAGDKVEVTGVCRAIWSEKALRFGRSADKFELQLQDGDSIVLRSAASWWTPRRLAGLAAGIFAVLVGSVIWSLVLRRRVGRRSDLLVKEIRARRDGELLAAERMRLAGDLHDTLSQSLSGAAMQLEVAGALADPEGEAGEHFRLAKRLLDRSREDLRRAVWDLSPSGLGDLDLASALEKMAAETAGSCRIGVDASGDVAALPERVRVHLFRVAQEAVGNALKHAKPGKVDVRIEVSGGMAALVVVDDGGGFDPRTAPGPDSGHFGLRSLKERVARLGGRLEISSSPAGTRLVADVPFSP